MRRFLLGITAVSILLVITGTGASAALAAKGTLQPGDTLFPLQYFAEQSQARLITSDSERAQHYISIAGRRVTDMGNVAGTENELLAIYYLNQVLDQTALSIAATDTAEFENLRISLAQLVSQIRDTVSTLSIVPTEHPDVLEIFNAKVDSFQKLVVNPDTLSSNFASLVDGGNSFAGMLTDNVSVPGFVENNDIGNSQSIPFPANSPGAQHAFFPLIGEHALIVPPQVKMEFLASKIRHYPSPQPKL